MLGSLGYRSTLHWRASKLVSMENAETNIDTSRKWRQRAFQYLKYDYKLTLWLNLNRWRGFVAFLEKHFDFIRRVSLVIIATAIGILINHFGGTNLTQEILSNYLVAAGAMAGGTIAIVFTISIFLLQNASDLYSSQYFEVYIHDWKERFVYFVAILITLLLLGAGLFVGGLSAIPQSTRSLTVLLSLILIGLIFVLIDWQYKNVRQKTNPSKAIAFLEKSGIRFLSRLQYDAGKMAEIIQAKDISISKELALATAYNRFLQPFISNFDRQLENLVEISTRIADKQEVGTTKRAFTAVCNLLAQFLEARKTSSLALPSGILFLAVESDSQHFLARNFERLNKAGEKFIKEQKDEIATYLIDVYRALATKAKDITYISQRNENPILDQLIGYLNSLIDNGQRAKNIEVVYQGSGVLGDVAGFAADKGLETTLQGLQGKLLNIAIFGLTQKQNVLVDQCTVTFLSIIAAIFNSTNINSREHQFDDALENIATISSYISTFIASGLLPNDISTRFSLSKGYDEFYMVLAGIMKGYDSLTDDQEKDTYRSDFVDFFHEINSSLRTLSEKVKSCDTTLTDSIGRLLFNLNDLIIRLIENIDFKDEKEELRRRLSWNIHFPGWFTQHAEKFDGGSNPFNTLTDSVAKTGILASEKLNDKKLLQDCVDSLYFITKQSLEKTTGGFGYDEPPVLEKACYLGIIALKKGWRDVVTDIGLKIYEFEQKYFAKYFTNIPENIDPADHNVIGLPHSDQLLRELLNWRNDYERESWSPHLRIRDDAESMMYGVIETIDIDRFIFEVWGVLLPGSQFEEVLELKLARQYLLYTLGNVIITRKDSWRPHLS